jgi:hypothetical protein
MRRIADIARTLLMFIGRGFALTGRALGAPTPFRLLLGPLPLRLLVPGRERVIDDDGCPRPKHVPDVPMFLVREGDVVRTVDAATGRLFPGGVTNG